jgi:transglycosylase-like protein with SLT domain
MKIPVNLIRSLDSAALLILVCWPALAQGELQSSRDSTQSQTSSQTCLRLEDGSSISVDEAWESEQGIWYRVGGLSHLISRDRVKTIERGSNSKPAANLQVAKVVQPNSPGDKPDEQPVWIYLKGGARVEADSANESVTGVWYRRGSLTIFVDRARIDRIEREDLETVAESDSSSKKERGWTTGNGRIDSLIKQNGAKYGVDPYLIFCVMEQESRFNTRALSPKGARGLMQLMPGTAARFGVRRPSDPAQNIAGGTRYLKQLIGQFNGRIDLVLASYNAGEGAVLKFGRKVPPYRETRNYVKRISYRYRRGKPVERAKSNLPVSTTSGL